MNANLRNLRNLRLLVLLVVMSALSGCGHEVVPSTGPREPLSADVVKIYPNYPRKYERLGTVTLPITPELAWDQTGRADAAVARLKSQAAALGANGLLMLPDDADSFEYFATVRYGKRESFALPMRSKPPTAVAEAIYVIKE
jgi:hypothetical protein